MGVSRRSYDRAERLDKPAGDRRGEHQGKCRETEANEGQENADIELLRCESSSEISRKWKDQKDILRCRSSIGSYFLYNYSIYLTIHPQFYSPYRHRLVSDASLQEVGQESVSCLQNCLRNDPM